MHPENLNQVSTYFSGFELYFYPHKCRKVYGEICDQIFCYFVPAKFGRYAKLIFKMIFELFNLVFQPPQNNAY